MKLALIFVFVSSFSLFGQIPAGTWSAVEVQTSGTKRHESAFVNCDGVLYALGGRGKRPVGTYNPNHTGLPAWPTYNATNTATMHLDTTCVVKPQLDKDLFAL